MISPDTTQIAFIGTGVMGTSMVKNLIEAGYEVLVYNRTEEHARACVEAGATWKPSVADVVYDADVVITIVGYPEDVEELYFATDGILESAQEGAYLVDMTTSSPRLAKEIFQIAETNGMHALDAPVSGGDIGAKEGTLTIMVGGKEEDFEKMLPIFEVLGKEAVWQGPAGSGQHAKMANQIAIAGTMLSLAETLTYAEAAGLDPKKVLKSVNAGSGQSWSLENYAPRVLNDDFDPGFFVKHFIKDMNIALTEAEEMELSLPGLDTAKTLYDILSAIGGDELGTQAICLLYSDEATCAAHGLDWERVDLDEEEHDYDHDHGEINPSSEDLLKSPLLNEN